MKTAGIISSFAFALVIAGSLTDSAPEPFFEGLGVSHPKDLNKVSRGAEILRPGFRLPLRLQSRCRNSGGNSVSGRHASQTPHDEARKCEKIPATSRNQVLRRRSARRSDPSSL